MKTVFVRERFREIDIALGINTNKEKRSFTKYIGDLISRKKKPANNLARELADNSRSKQELPR